MRLHSFIRFIPQTIIYCIQTALESSFFQVYKVIVDIIKEIGKFVELFSRVFAVKHKEIIPLLLHVLEVGVGAYEFM